MKKITSILFSIMFLLSFKSHAQMTIGDFQKLPVDAKTKLVTDSLRTMLNLSDAQYPLVYKATLNGIAKATTIRQSDEGRMAKRKEARDVLSVYKSEMKNILSPSQQELLQSKVKSLIAYYRGQAKNMPLVFSVQ